jgi:hypothetical protein
VKIHNVEQSSLDWLKLHIGLPTASGLDNLLTPEFEQRKGETPRNYVFKKLAEAWRGKPMIDLGASSFMMEQGLILESEALPFWELTTGRKVTRVGFITTDDGRFGCSPDGIILDYNGDGLTDQVGIEIKCPAPHTHVKYLSEGVVPKEYRAQVQGGMFATGFSKWVFLSYCRGFPPLILEVLRDEKQQEAIAVAVDQFHKSLGVAEAQIERFQKNPFNEFKK